MASSSGRRLFSVAGAIAAASVVTMVMAGCGSAGNAASDTSAAESSSSSSSASTPAAETASAGGTASSSSSGAAESTTGGAITVPAGALITPGTLTVCSDITSPPLEFYPTGSKEPSGSDIDLGNAMAAKMGLKTVWANTNFSGIIPALQAKRCDVIMSQLYIKPEREKVVDFVPYMYSGSTFMVKQQGGLTLSTAEDLCGKKAAAETGTTVVQYLQQTSTKCVADGKKAIDIRQFNLDADALQQLKIGLVDAYGTTVETAAYDISQNKGEFVMAGQPFNRVKVGAATNKDNTALHDALAQALAAIHADGQYTAIMKKWLLDGDILDTN